MTWRSARCGNLFCAGNCVSVFAPAAGGDQHQSLRPCLRVFRIAPLSPHCQVAPISTNLIYSFVAEHILGLPRSF